MSSTVKSLTVPSVFKKCCCFLALCFALGSSDAGARAMTKPRPIPAPCWITLPPVKDVSGSARVMVCGLGLSPKAAKHFATQCTKRHAPRKNTPPQPLGNLLMEAAMGLCSRWYAQKPGELAACANKKRQQLSNRVRLPPKPKPVPPPDAELARIEQHCLETYAGQTEKIKTCMVAQLTALRRIPPNLLDGVPEPDRSRAKNHCDRLAGDDRESFVACLQVQAERIRRFQPPDTPKLPHHRVSGLRAACEKSYGDDRAGFYYCFYQALLNEKP